MSRGMDVCKMCHKTLHTLIPKEKEMGRNYNTRELLLSHPQVANYVEWKGRAVA